MVGWGCPSIFQDDAVGDCSVGDLGSGDGPRRGNVDGGCEYEGWSGGSGVVSTNRDFDLDEFQYGDIEIVDPFVPSIFFVSERGGNVGLHRSNL